MLVFAFAAAQANAAPLTNAAPQTNQLSYRIEVPVVGVVPVVQERRISRPERHCSPAKGASYSSSVDQRYRENYYRNDDYRNRRRHNDRTNNVGAQILGGLIGGAIGNQFGKGNGRKALTIAGAMVGSSVARDRSRHRQREQYGRYDREPEYVCRTTHRERVIEEVIGYDVTYEYNGTTAVKRMDSDPGDTLELRVSASPALTHSRRRAL